jgi:hypothetical protein
MEARALRHVFGRDRNSPAIHSFSAFHFDNAYRELPEPTGPYPFRMDLEDVLGVDEVDRIAHAKKLVFHVVGDTGNRGHGAEAQDAVAEHMVKQLETSDDASRPKFFYHTGDVVYYNGERFRYDEQFYDPYQHYTAPIVAIPGNHDGAVPENDTPLQGFKENFCASQPLHTSMAGASHRTTMIQPHCYWTFKTPLATIIGLYSNVPGRLDKAARTQEQWLIAELAAAANEKCVIVAVHHPPYSLDNSHGGTKPIEESLDRAFVASGRIPNLVLTAHVHNYQRFERDMTGLGGSKLAYVVAGAGGFAGYSKLHPLKLGATPPAGVTLKKSNTELPGFLRMTITDTKILGDYFTVPAPPNHLTGNAVKFETFTIDL